MRTASRLLTLAALASIGLTADREARAQNTYADAPFQQGSLFYRPSGRKPPATTNSSSNTAGPRRFFRRPPAYTYAAPQPAYRPAYPAVNPGYAPAYTPQPVVPTARYYYYPAR